MQQLYEPASLAAVEEDDLPVTYQVTMIGKDGIVMASDRCECWKDQGARLSRTTNKVRKIYSRGKIAWTFSGGNLSGIAAAYLEREITGKEDAETLKQQVRTCGDQASANFQFPPTNADVLVVVHTDYPNIIRAHVSKRTACIEIEDGKFVSGDSDNLASFFPERYYSRDKSVDELTVLAAYAVFMAHHFSPRHVEDLDIAAWRKGTSEFQFLDRERCKSAARTIDAKIWECFRLELGT